METQALDVAKDGWTRERIDLVKRTVVPKGIPDDEFALFIEQCKRSGLDPLVKEAFCVGRRFNFGTKDAPKWGTKYEFQPSEAGMLSRAERFPDYEGIQAAAVFAEDDVAVDAGGGTVHHVFNPAKRKGALVGAWARVQRTGKVPVVVWLDFAGYVQQTPLWSKIPTTMLEKCARVAALRKAYPAAFGGLYVKEEMPADEFVEVAPAHPAAQHFRRALAERVAEGERAVAAALPADTNLPDAAEAVGRVEAPRQAVAREAQEAAERVTRALGGEAQPAPAPVPVAFGPWKGRPVTDLADDELSAAIDFAEAKLAAEPRAKWAGSMRGNLTALVGEVDRRMAAAQPAAP